MGPILEVRWFIIVLYCVHKDSELGAHTRRPKDLLWNVGYLLEVQDIIVIVLFWIHSYTCRLNTGLHNVNPKKDDSGSQGPWNEGTGLGSCWDLMSHGQNCAYRSYVRIMYNPYERATISALEKES